MLFKQIVLCLAAALISTPLTLKAAAQSVDQPPGTTSSPAQNTDANRRSAYAFVANVPIQSRLRVGSTTLPLKGRISLHLEGSSEQLKAGAIEVKQFNLLYSDVNQSALTGTEPQARRKVGALGISILASEQSIRLKYDPQTQTAIGEIPVQVHFPQLDELFPPQLIEDPKEADFFVSRTQRGRVKLQLQFADSPDKVGVRVMQSQAVSQLTTRTSATVEVEPIQDGGRAIVSAYRLDLPIVSLSIQIAPLFRFEVGNSLCLQPVRIRNNVFDPTPTGAGLAFGQPGANTQWNKADVVFQVRNMMTINNAALKIASAGAEENQIRASVDVDDCIEVFFVQNFTPVSLHGGGATWSSGTANAKIISSDGNAVGGIDLTHFAHELGHVLNMGHPGNPGSLYNASTGTLMCPSGWMNDNPRRNSLNNATNVSNPLLTFTLKKKTPGSDCNGNADCGGCP